METDTEWSPCKELSNERNAIIAKGDTRANKKKETNLIMLVSDFYEHILAVN